MNELSLFEIKSNEDIIHFVKSCPKIEYTEGFKKILKFYLFECPAITKDNSSEKPTSISQKYRISVRSTLLSEYGFEKSKLITLFNYFTRSVSIQQFAENLDHIKTKANQFVLITPQKDISRPSSILHHIRNAFAHGSFIVKSGVYTFMFTNPKRTKILGYAKLKEKTLLDWMRVIQSGKIPESQNHKKKKGK